MLTGVLPGIETSSAFEAPGPLLILTVPKVMEVMADAGDAEATCRKESIRAAETPATAQRRNIRHFR